MRTNLNNDQIVPAALRSESAQTKKGNMSTDHYRPGFTRYGAPYAGSLPRVWRRWLDSRFSAGAIAQVVYSYSTPIAWFDDTYGWTIPAETYSVTTSTKHQTHLYRLRGTTYAIPHDATEEDVRRVFDGEMYFTYKGYGRNRVFTGTVPGPNYISGIVAEGERIRFRDMHDRVRVGVITRKGSIAGFAMVDGVEVRFDDFRIMGGA